MSAISSAGSGQGLFQFLQRLSSGIQSQSTSAASTTSGPGQAQGTDSTSTDPSASGATAPVGGHHHHHHRGGQGGGFSKIESAVTSALQSAQQDGSSSDPNKVIEDAIAKIFKSGTSTGQTSATTSPTAGSTSTGGAGGTTSTGGTSSSGDAAHQAFVQTLQSLGVSPQQFHQDFLAAVQDAQGGTSDPTTAFQSFPPGSGIDVTA